MAERQFVSPLRDFVILKKLSATAGGFFDYKEKHAGKTMSRTWQSHRGVK